MLDKFLKKVKQYSGSSGKRKHKGYRRSSSDRKFSRSSSSGHRKGSPFEGSSRYKRKGRRSS